MCIPGTDYHNLTFRHYGTSNGLVNDMVQAIAEDKQGNLWIATEYGISRFNPETQAFDNYFFSAYTLGNVYSDNSSCVSKNGSLLFGTNYGLLVINPEQMGNNSVLNSSITFTNLQVNGISMRPGAPTPPSPAP